MRAACPPLELGYGTPSGFNGWAAASLGDAGEVPRLWLLHPSAQENETSATSTIPPSGRARALDASAKTFGLADAPRGSLGLTFWGGECYGAQSDTSGAFAISTGPSIPTADYAMHPNGRPDHAVRSLRLTANEPPDI